MINSKRSSFNGLLLNLTNKMKKGIYLIYCNANFVNHRLKNFLITFQKSGEIYERDIQTHKTQLHILPLEKEGTLYENVIR